MKTKEFKYVKKDGIENDYNLLILNEDKTHLKGIDLNKLTEEEKGKLINIQKKYEEDLKPFMKAYRSFILENIIT